jgi:hypothetical protein
MKPWTRYSTERLLQQRICDLRLSLDSSPLAKQINRLYRELEKKGLIFKPHFWISDEWYSPDGVPGVAIPFFLVHPRLLKLEIEKMQEAEGSNPKWCMMLLRHETGHALLNAYKLDQNREWRKVFGNPNKHYPETYLPKPYSKRYVIHLPAWYAQAHPHEDWAETFAVWLDPKSDWKKKYHKWPALKKLEFVDDLMKQIAGKKPLLRNKRTESPVEKIKMTLGEYYAQKRERYGVDFPEFFDADLKKLFITKQEGGREKASTYIRKIKKDLLLVVGRWTGEYKYRINEVIKEMIKKCNEMELRVGEDKEQLFPNLVAFLTAVVMNKLHSGGFHIVL